MGVPVDRGGATTPGEVPGQPFPSEEPHTRSASLARRWAEGVHFKVGADRLALRSQHGPNGRPQAPAELAR